MCDVLFTSNSVNVCSKCSRIGGQYVRVVREREKALVAKAKEIIDSNGKTDDPIILTRIQELKENQEASDARKQELRELAVKRTAEWRIRKRAEKAALAATVVV